MNRERRDKDCRSDPPGLSPPLCGRDSSAEGPFSGAAIAIRGARQHNLRGWDLDIPVGQWVTVTGVSGSGKSSLAMDILYAEGQRRYLETFSPYARQFLERMDRPDVDEVRGIPPALAIEGTHPVRTSRSTVGTMTELADYLKLLYARMAVPFCHRCGKEIKRTTPDGLWEESRNWKNPTPWVLTFPIRTEGRDGELIRKGLLRMGFFRVWRDGEIVHLDDGPAPSGVETEWVVADRFVAPPESRGRFVESVEAAFRYGKGELAIHFQDGTTLRWTNQWRCIECDVVVQEPSPNLFSFNSPVGACPNCKGFGRIIDIDPDLVVPDRSKSIGEGAVRPFAVPAAEMEREDLIRFCRRSGIPIDVPWAALEEAHRKAILEGTEDYYGVKGFFRWLQGKSYKMHVRVFLSRFRAYVKCPQCQGARLRPEALRWRIGGKTLPELCAMDVESVLRFLDEIQGASGENPALLLLLAEIRRRLRYLSEVGLPFLTLDRPSRTLSGGEVERVMLTRALGSNLVNTLFVLDEPSVGLHARDIERLSRVIRNLVCQGNTAVVVEHDLDMIRASDQVVDLGPGAGGRGGGLVFFGRPSQIGEKAPESVTGQYLEGTRCIPVPARRRRPRPDRVVVLRAVEENNLKGMDVVIPLGLLVCITGVSGSGKSTLVLDILYRGLLRAKGVPCERPGRFGGLDGAHWVDHVELVDQRRLGRTPRANPATYTKAWDWIRRTFSSTEEARRHGWGPGHFSFNVPGGRCETCRGEGFTRVEMQFLSDVLLRCPDCQGRRFRGDILQVLYKGRSIADVLGMTVEEAIAFFRDRPGVVQALSPLAAMGLAYLPLGQPLSTLSGGEAQRLRLARFLSGVEGHNLFILDEPTTGLHMEDVRNLLGVLTALVERGHSVVVVEHHLDVIKCADHVIDLGPEGGEDGGWIVAQGSPEEIASNPRSHTGRYLRGRLEAEPQGRPLPSARGRDVERGGSSVAHAIEVRGAREHNLRDLNLHIPRDRLVAITGVSGSGKSTLAFDILFNEGQRRYLESLPAYVRQYIRVLDRPEVDVVSGIPPTVAIEQRTAKAGRRSTVATLTEVYHFLRLLYARLGVQHCPRCRIPISHGSIEGIVQAVLRRFQGKEIQVLAPKIAGRKGLHARSLEQARRRGILRVRVDGSYVSLDGSPVLDRYREHWVEWVIADGVSVASSREKELRLSLERALHEGGGTALIVADDGEEATYSRRSQCPECHQGFGDLDPRHFSFNSPMGACSACDGLGVIERGDRQVPCPSCEGERISPRARFVEVLGLTISRATAMTITEAREFWCKAEFPGDWKAVSEPIVSEIVTRLEALERLGVGYLTLDRSGETLSGGESQRIRLAAQMGSNLRGVCYVLDEPTIGLHPRDQVLLMGSLRALRDRGNTVVVVEHDEATIKAADWIMELGPGPGLGGGRLVAEGTFEELLESRASITVNAFSEGSRRGLTSRGRGARDGRWIEVKGACQNNLKGIDVKIPLGTVTCVTGVSGSGKSSLVDEVLYSSLRGLLNGGRGGLKGCKGIQGHEALERILKVDHSPIGKTPRSTPATYVGLWDEIRRLFSGLPEARSRGYGPGRFSFNVPAGRCPVCEGQGVVRKEMNFLPDVYMTCEACDGRRFTRETLSVSYKGRNITEVLGMTVEEALAFFHDVPRARRALQVLRDLGLGYLTLGQPSPTISGGEAQRVKLAQELSKNSGGRNLYILDEPTTGLHLLDVRNLLETLHRLADRGDTVVVVEHNLDVIAAADYIIDLGPEGGQDGGEVVAQGPPREILRAQGRSHTARWLRRFLNNDRSDDTQRTRRNPREALCH